MRSLLRTLTVLTLAALIAVPAAMAKPAKKKPLGAYIKSAKIEILSGDMERYENAIALLDTLFMFYGPQAEALSLMSQIQVDFTDKASSPADKKPHVEAFKAYIDSLHMCCENKDIKKKYRDKCDEYIKLADSTKVKYWREFYNLGIDQLGALETAADEIKEETDSTALAYMKEALNANIDSCVANMKLAVIVDPNDYRAYVAIGNVYEQREDYEKSIEWYGKGLAMTEDSSTLLISIAYDYIHMNNFCGAIPYFKLYLAQPANTQDVGNMGNLAACYINCKFLDSAVQVYQQMVEIDPANVDALVSIGLFYNQLAAKASSKASDTKDEAEKAALQTERNDYFDSALVYFTNAHAVDPENVSALENVALVNAILGKYDVAAIAYEKLVILKPGVADFYTSLGDCQLYLKNFEKATEAYEKVVEILPGKLPIWENLAALYKELGMPKKEKAAEAKVKELKGS